MVNGRVVLGMVAGVYRTVLSVAKQWVALKGLGGPRLSPECEMPSEASSQEFCGGSSGYWG